MGLEKHNKASEAMCHKGYCEICERETIFRIDGEWLREHYLCTQCFSTPRQRALLHVLNQCHPNWRNAAIHESSPGSPSSDKFYREGTRYTFSHYYPGIPSGVMGPDGALCENLEALSFPDASFEIFITQDVLEHIFNPSAALREIARVLVPGGIHIFTVPRDISLMESRCRARCLEGRVEYLEEAVFHGNPVDEKGALVTWDYGMDLAEQIFLASGLFTESFLIKDRSLGLDGELLEVFISRKPRFPISTTQYGEVNS